MDVEPDEEVSEERFEGLDLCLCCLEPIRPGANFCTDCGAPQGLSTVLPYQRILAEGFCYRQAVQRPRCVLSVVGIWLIFGTMVVGGIGGIVVCLDYLQYDLGFTSWLGLLVPPFWGVVGIVGIVTSTRNYLRYRKSVTG